MMLRIVPVLLILGCAAGNTCEAASDYLSAQWSGVDNLTPSNQSDAISVRLAQRTSAQQNTSKCPREGSVRLRVGGQLFKVPRLILGQVRNAQDKMDEAWRCSDQAIVARNFVINVRSIFAGSNFYNNWILERKLPHTIEIAERGRFITFNDQRIASLVEKGGKGTTDALGYRIVETVVQSFYDASGLGLRGLQGQSVVFVCSKNAEAKNAIVCHTNYRLDDAVDLRYEFLDPPNSQPQWPDLDRRTREFVRSLIPSQ